MDINEDYCKYMFSILSELQTMLSYAAVNVAKFSISGVEQAARSIEAAYRLTIETSSTKIEASTSLIDNLDISGVNEGLFINYVIVGSIWLGYAAQCTLEAQTDTEQVIWRGSNFRAVEIVLLHSLPGDYDAFSNRVREQSPAKFVCVQNSPSSTDSAVEQDE